MSSTIILFLLAGLAEIGGGYLVWLWLREAKPVWYGLVGGLILVLYVSVKTQLNGHVQAIGSRVSPN